MGSGRDLQADDSTSERLILRVVSSEHVAAVVADCRQPDWASDFPSAGDREIAAMLARDKAALPSDLTFAQRLVVERATGLLVGGIGFFGTPQDGRIELGYGIVESRRSRGYATEAVRAMVDLALADPAVTQVIATVEPDNPASIRVLAKSGFIFESRTDDLLTYGTPIRV